LFEQASKIGRSLELDRMCRETALKGFAEMDGHNRTLLSLNLDISCIDKKVAGSGTLLSQTEKAGIDNNHIILEILESMAASTEALLEFISFYKSKDFLIALDDVGSGFSNLARIPLIKPDILKLDRSLVRDVHKYFYKQELIRSFVQMARRMGSQVVAEGVEDRGEVVCLLKLGIELFQGFYFARPGMAPLQDPALREKIKDASVAYKKDTTERLSRDREITEEYCLIMDRICTTFNYRRNNLRDSLLAQCLEAYPMLECLYILNTEGIQISSTICDPERLAQSRQLIYEPAPKGSDHSLKEYYLPIQAGQKEHITAPYISLASGNQCVTISRFLSGGTRENGIILCADIACTN